MKPVDLTKQTSHWLDHEGPDSQIVVSSRVRLARNLANYEFQPCLTEQRQQEILDSLRTQLLSVVFDRPLMFIDVAQATQLEQDLLAERRLISIQHARGKGPRGLVMAKGETFTAMINEEDHLRMQAFAPGRQIAECFDRVNSIDDQLESRVNFAFSSHYGYLTACPTNLGTGIRVSVMLHLPAMKLTGQIEKFLNAARDCNLAVRGFFGEGTEAVGDFYQLSNQVTLGVSEKDIVTQFTDQVVPRIVEYEQQARDLLKNEKPHLLDDKVQRAIGILKSARLISSQEAMVLLSMVRLGIYLDRVKDIPIQKINDLFLKIQPAHLQITAGNPLTPDQRDELRAQLIRQTLTPKVV